MPGPDMMGDRKEEQIRDVLPLYALGLLDAEEARLVDEHLLTGCAACAHELREFREVAGQIPYAFRSVTPPPRVREKLLASITPKSNTSLEQPLPGIFVLKKDAGDWRKTPFAGVTYKLLYFDKESRFATSLLKMQPGAQYPAHRHAGCEQCLVVEGDVRIGSVAVSKGDFEYALAGTEHGVLTTDSGCVLLIIAHKDDEVFA